MQNHKGKQLCRFCDPKGKAFFQPKAKHFEQMWETLQVVHPTRLQRVGPLQVNLMHGPRDLGLKSYREVKLLLGFIRRGTSLYEAYYKVDVTAQNYSANGTMDPEAIRRAVDSLSMAYEQAGPPKTYEVQYHKPKVAKSKSKKKDSERLGNINREVKPKHNATPLPEELTPEERRAIWQPPYRPHLRRKW